jgi:hypothetical protein
MATHSADFLRGVIDSGHQRIKVVRISRGQEANNAHELNTHDIKTLWADPILRFSNILDGLFHDLVVVCEAESDCCFYSAVAGALLADGQSACDVLWASTNGKERFPKVIAALTGLHVPVRAVADFDILRAEQPLADIVESLGGSWRSFEDDWLSVKRSVECKFPPPKVCDVRAQINAALHDEVEDNLSPRGAERIRQSVRATSPWELVKLSGTSGVPSGQPMEKLLALLGKLRDLGLFVVKCGELERFVPDVGGKGPKWVSEVLSTKDLAKDPALEEARKFVSELIDLKKAASD